MYDPLQDISCDKEWRPIKKIIEKIAKKEFPDCSIVNARIITQVAIYFEPKSNARIVIGAFGFPTQGELFFSTNLISKNVYQRNMYFRIKDQSGLNYLFVWLKKHRKILFNPIQIQVPKKIIRRKNK